MKAIVGGRIMLQFSPHVSYGWGGSRGGGWVRGIRSNPVEPPYLKKKIETL